jgi:hypothetical protein
MKKILSFIITLSLLCGLFVLSINQNKLSAEYSSSTFKEVEKLCLENNIYYIRIDTHHKNKLMQHVFEKNGFKYCGTCFFHGSDKLAYDKILEKKQQ